jgi:hypothetical protein
MSEKSLILHPEYLLYNGHIERSRKSSTIPTRESLICDELSRAIADLDTTDIPRISLEHVPYTYTRIQKPKDNKNPDDRNNTLHIPEYKRKR